MKLKFEQVNVFSQVNMKGNPLAVVIGADALTDQQLFQFAQWTNVSETIFLLSPRRSSADYRVQIFTPPW